MSVTKIEIDKNHFDQLLGQVTRIADALQMQQEINLAQLQQLQNKPRPSVDDNGDIKTCKALIMAANRMGDSMKTVAEAVDGIHAGQTQTADRVQLQLNATQNNVRQQNWELNQAANLGSNRTL
jgi:hypothetical protein